MITRKPDVVKKYVEIILGAGVVGAELEQRIPVMLVSVHSFRMEQIFIML